MITRRRALTLLLVVVGVSVLLLSLASVATAASSVPDKATFTQSSTTLPVLSGGWKPKQVSGTWTYYLAGQKMFWFTSTKYWEYNGLTVRNVKYWADAGLTTLATLSQWRYDGVVGSGASYQLWNGRTNGCHYNWKRGQFSQVIAGVTTAQRRPRIDIWVYGDGNKTITGS